MAVFYWLHTFLCTTQPLIEYWGILGRWGCKYYESFRILIYLKHLLHFNSFKKRRRSFKKLWVMFFECLKAQSRSFSRKLFSSSMSMGTSASSSASDPFDSESSLRAVSEPDDVSDKWTSIKDLKKWTHNRNAIVYNYIDIFKLNSLW